jgi:hypothetical protein
VEALTKQNGVRLLGKFKKKFKKKVKTDLPYLSFYKKKLETHIFFFGLSNQKMSNFHFDPSLKLSQGEVHYFSGEVQKLSGEVRTSPRNPAMQIANDLFYAPGKRRPLALNRLIQVHNNF